MAAGMTFIGYSMATLIQSCCCIIAFKQTTPYSAQWVFFLQNYCKFVTERCGSAVVNMLAYHAASPGSIPGQGGEHY